MKRDCCDTASKGWVKKQKVAAWCFVHQSNFDSKSGANLKFQVGEGSPQLGSSSKAGGAHLDIEGDPQRLIISAFCQGVRKAETFYINCSPQRPCEGSGGHLQYCLSLGSLHHVGPWEKKQYEHEYVWQGSRYCSHDFTVPVHWTVSIGYPMIS